jgi:signal transduction histidine kinase
MISLRFRITAIVAIVSALGFVATSVIVFGHVRRDQDKAIETFLRDGLKSARELVEANSGSTNIASEAIAGLPFDGAYADARDQNGKLIGEPIALGLGGRVPDRVVLPSLLGPATQVGRVFSARDSNGRRFRVIYGNSMAEPPVANLSGPQVSASQVPRSAGARTESVPVSPGRAAPSISSETALGKRDRVSPGPAVFAVSTNSRDKVLTQLLRTEIFAAGLVTAIVAMLSWLLVGLGLRPLRRIEQSAATIAAGDLSHRIKLASERTEVGRLGVSLNLMLGQIESSHEELRRFLADASHELRTPLTSIRAYAELFRIGPARGGKLLETAMSRIESESERMGVLVDRLLELARSQQQGLLSRQLVSLTELCEKAIADAKTADARFIARDRLITVVTEGDTQIHGDVDCLMQLVVNLLTNARVHSPVDSSVCLVVQGMERTVRLRVIDHGPGVIESMRTLIFQPFFRSDPSRTRSTGGAGLGLAIVFEIVRVHAGRVWVEDTEGGGATFVVDLPRTTRSGAPLPG